MSYSTSKLVSHCQGHDNSWLEPNDDNFFSAGNSWANSATNGNAGKTASRCSLSQRKHSPGTLTTSRGSLGKTRESSGTPRGSPVPFSASRSREKLLPLVTNDLVLAQGSQRALVLTHGGARCNDYQLQIERRLINKHDMKKTNTGLAKCTWHKNVVIIFCVIEICLY